MSDTKKNDLDHTELEENTEEELIDQVEDNGDGLETIEYDSTPPENFKPIDFNSLKLKGTYETYLNYTNGQSIKFVLNRQISRIIRDKTREQASTWKKLKNGQTVKDYDEIKHICLMWEHLVVRTEPPFELTDVNLLPDEKGDEIILFVLNEYKKLKENLPQTKKK